MSIYETSVNKPITTALIFVAVVIIGLFSFSRLAIDLMPESDPTRIMVMTTYPGASAEDIENNVSKVLENRLIRVENLKHISSQSKENISITTLDFSAGTDITEATNNVRDNIDASLRSLPDGVDKPTIFKFSTADIPIAIIAVESKESFPALKKILEDKVTNPLSRVDGVGSVSISGTEERIIHIYADPAKLEAYGLTIAQISRIITTENTNISAGSIDVGTKSSSIRVMGEVKNPDDLGNIPVAIRNGNSIYLKDVATIKDASAEKNQENYINGYRGATIVINKQSGANSVAISETVKKILPQLSEELPKDVKLNYLIDTSDFIVDTIDSLKETILITIIIVMLVVFVFLGGWKPTIIVSLTIPISLIASFAYLFASGNTLNIISLSSLSIAIGMVVDDAIVVLENISSHMKRGSYAKPAAIHGTNEVGISVIASTLTMLAVFLPLTMIQGQTGLMFRQLGWIISIVMIVSTVAALSLIPMLSSLLLKKNPKQSKLQDKIFSSFNRAFAKLEDFYADTLNWAVRHRKRVIILAMSIFFGSFLLLPFIKSNFMSNGDMGFLNATLEFKAGTKIELPRKIALEISKEWKEKFPEVKTVSMLAGQADASNTFNAMQANGEHIVTFNIGLVPALERERSSEEIAIEMQKIVAKYKEIETYIVKASTGGGGTTKDVTLDLFAFDFAASDKVAKELRAILKEKASISSVEISRKEYAPEYKFVFDKKKLADNNINLSTAGQYLLASVRGLQSSFYREDGNEYQIRVSLDPAYRRELSDLRNINVYTADGVKLRLGDLGEFVESQTPPSIDRKDRSRVVTLSLSPAPKYALSDVVKDLEEALNKVEMPQDMSYKIGGAYENEQESSGELKTLMLLIIVLVFIVMAAQFESLSTPFVIMFSVPFAFTGVFIGLFITQIPMGTMAMIGLIMLIGIVVKNGIVLIDYTIICQERGMGVIQSVVTAGKSRLRPVIMTTLTTVLGMVPMAIGIGSGAEMWQSMGVTVAWGLSFSTVITLILIPTMYASFYGIRMKKDRKMMTKKIR